MRSRSKSRRGAATVLAQVASPTDFDAMSSFLEIVDRLLAMIFEPRLNSRPDGFDRRVVETGIARQPRWRCQANRACQCATTIRIAISSASAETAFETAIHAERFRFFGVTGRVTRPRAVLSRPDAVPKRSARTPDVGADVLAGSSSLRRPIRRSPFPVAAEPEVQRTRCHDEASWFGRRDTNRRLQQDRIVRSGLLSRRGGSFVRRWMPAVVSSSIKSNEREQNK